MNRGNFNSANVNRGNFNSANVNRGNFNSANVNRGSYGNVNVNRNVNVSGGGYGGAYYGGGWGGVAAGVAAGAIVGGAIASTAYPAPAYAYPSCPYPRLPRIADLERVRRNGFFDLKLTAHLREDCLEAALPGHSSRKFDSALRTNMRLEITPLRGARRRRFIFCLLRCVSRAYSKRVRK